MCPRSTVPHVGLFAPPRLGHLRYDGPSRQRPTGTRLTGNQTPILRQSTAPPSSMPLAPSHTA
eukprot:14798950-Alexandrium_andersonii.AAC.1